MISQRDRSTAALKNKAIDKLFFDYALPAIVATTASSLYNIIDRIFIGHGVGPLAIAGLALTFPIMNLAVALGTLVGAGASSIVSIRMGERRRMDAIQTLCNSLLLNIIIGISFTVIALIFLNPILKIFGASADTLPYARDFMQIILMGNVITHVFFGLNNVMRASGHPMKAMISILLTVGVNVILAPTFIFGFKWGIRGAATATVISQTCGLIWVLGHFCSKHPYIHFSPFGFKLSGKIIKDIVSIGLSPFIIHICASLVVIFINLQLKRYGDLDYTGIVMDGHPVAGGDMAIGAFGIINSIVGFIVMILFGFTQGMQPIAGYNYGALQMDRVKQVLRLAIGWASGVAIVGFLLCMIFPRGIAHMFTGDPHINTITQRGMRLYMLMFMLTGFQVVTSTFFQAIGKASISIFLSMTRQLIFLIPFIFILPLFWSSNGVWLAQSFADLLSAAVTAVVLMYHLHRGILSKKNSQFSEVTAKNRIFAP